MDIFPNLDLLGSWNEASLGIKLLLAFFAGLLTTLTPCVYPLLPITISIFGKDTAEKSRLYFSLRLLAYILGLIACYTVLGLITAFSGGIFGQYLGNKYFLLILIVVLVALALYTIEVLRFRVFDKFQNFGGRLRFGTGLVGIFLAGAGSGLIAAPCVGPVLVLILSQAALAKDVYVGGLLLFSFSLGLSVFIAVLAIFSNLLKKMPAAGSWFAIVKLIIASALLVTACYFARILNAEIFTLTLAWIPKWAAAIGIFLTFVFYLKQYKQASKFLTLIVSLLLSFGLAVIIWQEKTSLTPEIAASVQQGEWISDFEQAKMIAEQSGKKLIVDLYADWCLACIELEKKVLETKPIKAALQDYIKVRLDFSIDSDFTTAFSKRYQVIGLPCILFLDSRAEEIPNTRVTGLVSIDEFMKQIKLADKSQ